MYKQEKSKPNNSFCTWCGFMLCLIIHFLFDLGFGLFGRLANFDEKVNKPQSKSYGRIGFIFTHFLWIWIFLLVHHNFSELEKLQGTHIDAVNPFSSKVMTLTLWGGLWTFVANLALCALRPSHRRGRISSSPAEYSHGPFSRTPGKVAIWHVHWLF